MTIEERNEKIKGIVESMKRTLTLPEATEQAGDDEEVKFAGYAAMGLMLSFEYNVLLDTIKDGLSDLREESTFKKMMG